MLPEQCQRMIVLFSTRSMRWSMSTFSHNGHAPIPHWNSTSWCAILWCIGLHQVFTVKGILHDDGLFFCHTLSMRCFTLLPCIAMQYHCDNCGVMYAASSMHWHVKWVLIILFRRMDLDSWRVRITSSLHVTPDFQLLDDRHCRYAAHQTISISFKSRCRVYQLSRYHSSLQFSIFVRCMVCSIASISSWYYVACVGWSVFFSRIQCYVASRCYLVMQFNM